MGPLTAQRVVARTIDGVAVDVETDSFVVRADMPVARGGGGTAPPPGSIMRASIAACLVVGYKAWGTKLGVPIDGVEIEMTTEIDMRGQAEPSEVPPGWQQIRWHVRVTSSAPSSEVERVLEHADRLSPMLDNLHPRCERKRTFEVVRPAAGA